MGAAAARGHLRGAKNKKKERERREREKKKEEKEGTKRRKDRPFNLYNERGTIQRRI